MLVLPLLAHAIERGAGVYTFHPPGLPDRSVPVWTYWPSGVDETAPIVFVCHGVSRNADDYRDSWIPHARRNGFIVIAPEFSDDEFPRTRSYNLGNMFTSDGDPIPQAQWSFQVIEDLFDDVRSRLGGNQAGYALYGHSAGGQFVHRMLMFLPDVRVERAVIANPGWYTVPDPSIDYPHGLANSPWDSTVLAESFAHNHLILLGELDNDPNASSLNRTPEADVQGDNRFDRGIHFHRRATEFAMSNEIAFNWSLGYVPGVGHSNTNMAPYASDWLFSSFRGSGGLFYRGNGGWLTRMFNRHLPAEADAAVPWINNVTFPGLHVEYAAVGVPETYRVGNTAAAEGMVHWRSGDAATAGFIGGRPGDQTGDIHYAIQFVNLSQDVLNSFTLNYNAAQLRNSNSGVPGVLSVAWKTGELNSIAGEEGWVSVPELAFESPQPGDGQSPGRELNPTFTENRENRVATVDGLMWLPGESLWIRWTDKNAETANHAFAIGNMLFSAVRNVLEAGGEVRLAMSAIGGDELRIDLWNGEPGFFYQLQNSSGLSEWENAGPPQYVSGDSPHWILPGVSGSEFFRVLQYQP